MEIEILPYLADRVDYSNFKEYPAPNNGNKNVDLDSSLYKLNVEK